MKLLTINTMRMQDLISRVVKGCSNDKLLPMTSLIAISLKDNCLTLGSTDATNYLYVSTDKVDGDDFQVVVQMEQFSKLVAKMTSENITLELEDDNLIVTGNGKYTIELPLDEEGQLVRFPNPLDSVQTSDVQKLQLSTIKSVLHTAKPALSTDVNATGPCYTGYYCGSNIIATDTFKVCGMNIKLFDRDVMLSPEFVDLMSVFTNEDLNVKLVDDVIVVDDGASTIYGKLFPYKDDFQVDAINGLLGQGFDSMCKLPKSVLLSVLDRLALFIGTYDNNSVYLTFTNKGLNISSKKSTGVETIDYQESQNFKDFTCCIDIEMLSSQIKAKPSDTVELWYGESNAIKMIDGNVIQIVALNEDDR